MTEWLYDIREPAKFEGRLAGPAERKRLHRTEVFIQGVRRPGVIAARPDAVLAFARDDVGRVRAHHCVEECSCPDLELVARGEPHMAVEIVRGDVTVRERPE